MKMFLRSFIAPRLINFYRIERGSAESALVLVPTLILFLIGMQIAYTAHGRNVSKVFAQNEASRRAISGEFVAGDEFLHIESSGDSQNLDLLITHRNLNAGNLIPTLLNEGLARRNIDTAGIAIVENQR
jgi:hypothetical protein